MGLVPSSGEVAWRILAGRTARAGRPGTRCLLLARDDDLSAIDGLDLERSTSGRMQNSCCSPAAKATKLDARRLPRPSRAGGARAGVPCICTNPDKVMLTRRPRAFGAGQDRRTLRGTGRQRALDRQALSRHLPRRARGARQSTDEAVVAIGDSVEHDIAGAQGRWASPRCWSRSGILADHDAGQLEAVYREHGVTPDHVLASFVWAEG